MPLTQTIIEHLADFLVGSMSARELRVAMARASVAADTTDAETRALAYGVQHRLAEFTNGDWTEEELKELLRPLVSRYSMRITTTPTRARRLEPAGMTYRTLSLAEPA